MMWLGIILGVAIAACVFFAGVVLEGGWNKISRQQWVVLASGGLCGFLVTILAYAMKDPWPSVCKYAALVFVLLAYLALTIWWVREGGRWREFFAFALVGVLLFFPLKVVTMLLGYTVDAVSTLLVSLMTGIWPITLCFFKAQNYGRSEETKMKSKVYRVVAWILVALLVVDGVFGIYKVIKTLAPKEPEIVEQEPEPEPEPEPIPVPERWYALTAEELIQKSELTAELEAEIVPGNFGPKPVYDYENVKPEEVWEDLKAVSRVYPIVGISAIYYKDSVTGKRDLTEYYKAYDDDTDALNAAISYYIGLEPGAEANQYDPKPYQDFVDFVFENIEAYEPEYRIYTTKELKKLKMTVKDQLYMEPGLATVIDEDGNEIHVPKVVVWTSEMAEDDHFLYVRFLIKGRVVELWFHIECLFQPCNPSDVMRVLVTKNPNIPEKNKSGGGKTKTEEVGGKASTEEIGGKVTTEEVGGKVTFPMTHLKDPTRGTDVAENDNKGPGKDNNNGVGATVSRADTPTGTGPALMSDEQRHDWTEEQIRINETQRTADNTPENKPTTVVSNVDEIDSNAGKGTGNGGINEETKVKPAETINGGQQLQNSTEKTADGAWTPSEDVTKGANASVFETDGRVDTNFVPEPPAQRAAGGLDFGANG